MIELIMFISGWWYFSRLRKRIDDLETEVVLLKHRSNSNEVVLSKYRSNSSHGTMDNR
jgi:hypothetical protein